MARHHDNMWILHHHADSPHSQSHGKRPGYPSGKFQKDLQSLHFNVIMFLFLKELALLILGMLMFIASGGVVIDQYATAANALNSARPAALALGSMCIFTGLVFFVDVVFTALDISK